MPAGPPPSDPLSAVLAACAALGCRRIGLVSPYVAEVSGAMRTALTAHGLGIGAFGSFEEKEEARVARIAPDSIRAAALALGRLDTVDAVFLSCTNLRTLSIIADLEAELQKPVISSNQALAWQMARLAGTGPLDPAFGRLMTLG
ncbi:MAG: aspartate/glutamate racemase family protein [Geminicoccaceae bacterium]